MPSMGAQVWKKNLPPRTEGKRASSTRWPVSRGVLASSFCATGRGDRTGQAWSMVYSCTPPKHHCSLIHSLVHSFFWCLFHPFMQARTACRFHSTDHIALINIHQDMVWEGCGLEHGVLMHSNEQAICVQSHARTDSIVGRCPRVSLVPNAHRSVHYMEDWSFRSLYASCSAAIKVQS